MRLVRLFALTLILAAVYLAQALIHTSSVYDLLPEWLLNLAPDFVDIVRMLPADFANLAQWLMLIGVLSFGLIAPWWHGEHGRAYRRLPPGDAQLRPWWWVAQAALLPALVGAALSLFAPTWLTLSRGFVLWVATIVFYLVAGGLASRVRRPVVYGVQYSEVVKPASGWPMLLILLILLGGLYAFRLTDLPLRVDELSARVALTAQAWVDGQWPALAAPPATFPLPTLALTTFVHLLVDDNLLAARLTGLVAAFGLMVAVWLVATELYRRIPVYGAFGEVLEDDGRWLALLAVLALGVMLPMYHWSRMPVVLEGVMWSTFGLWTLLRGLRTDRPWLLGLSAFGFGWAVYYGPAGMLMVLLAILVWWGALLLQSEWLVGKELAVARRADSVRVQRGVGWRGFGYWMAGLGVMLAPLIGLWWRAPGAWAAQWTWLPGPRIAPLVEEGWLRLQLTLAGLYYLPDASGFSNYEAQFVPRLLAPLVALSVGALLLNLDSLVGWTLIAWLGVGIIGVALTAPVQPDWLAQAMILPAIALALAFVLDRLRVLIMRSAGTWSLQATTYLALGILVTAGFFGWVEFYGAGQREADLASAVGRVLRSSGDATILWVRGSTELDTILGDPVVQMLAGEEGDLTRVQSLEPVAWPPMPKGTRLLVAADGSSLPAALDAAYPGGRMTILRDLRANPILYIYDIGNATAAHGALDGDGR